MNVNSWMVLKSKRCSKKMANEKLGVATELLPESLLYIWGLYIVQWDLTFWNLNKYRCFVVFHISVWWGLGALFRRG